MRVMAATLVAFAMVLCFSFASLASENTPSDNEQTASDTNAPDRQFVAATEAENCTKSVTETEDKSALVVAQREPNCCGQCIIKANNKRGCWKGTGGNTYCSQCE